MAVAIAVVVVLSPGAPIVRRLCWPDIQRGTDSSFISVQ